MAGEAFARLLSVLPEPLLLVSASGAIRFANPAAAALLGANTLPAGADAFGAFLRSCARSGQLLPGAFTLTEATGEQRVYRVEGALLEPRTAQREALLVLRLTPREAASARFAALNLHIAELNRELARRRQLEQALRDERELLAVTLRSIGDAVIATDRDGRVTFINRVAQALTGWSEAESLGHALDEVFRIVNEETRAAVENPVARVLRERMVVGLANHTLLIRRDGGEIPIDDAGAPILDTEGRILGVVLVFRDITERRAVERERALAERRKDEFLAMLAHELRNPLAAIAAGVDLVRRAPRPDALAQVAEPMHRQVRQLARLVDDLLDVSRISTGKVILERRPVGLDELVEDALAAHRPALAAQAIALIRQSSPRPLEVLVDPGRLGQVIGNLVSNAIKFNHPGGSVRVATGVDGGWALVTVADTGEGIAPEILPSIFDLFMQGDTSLARSRGGLGVGLTVAKLIAEMHGGRIDARSEGPGKGAEFTVRLPLHVAAAAAPRTAAGVQTTAARRLNVLVVDDNADVANTIAALLGHVGHHVRVAYDGEAALRMHAQTAAEVLLVDLGMPGMDGYEVARRLRARGEGPAPRIIALSGYGAAADRARGAAAGFDGHLVKPVDAQTLEDLLERL